MGDTEEGVQALQEFAAVIPAAVRATMQAENDRAEMSAALHRSTQRYPQVLQDPDLGMAGYTVLARTMRQDLKRNAGISDEQLANARVDANNVLALGHAAAALRRQGHKVGSFEDHLNAAATEMGRKFAIRPGNGPRSRIATPEEVRARLDQKQHAMQQPRAAGLRMEPPEPARPKTPAEIVAEARRARGFPTDR